MHVLTTCTCTCTCSTAVSALQTIAIFNACYDAPAIRWDQAKTFRYSRLLINTHSLHALKACPHSNQIWFTLISNFNPLCTKLDQSTMITSTLRTQLNARNCNCAQSLVHMIGRAFVNKPTRSIDVGLATILFAVTSSWNETDNIIWRGNAWSEGRWVADRSGWQKQETCGGTDST